MNKVKIWIPEGKHEECLNFLKSLGYRTSKTAKFFKAREAVAFYGGAKGKISYGGTRGYFDDDKKRTELFIRNNTIKDLYNS